MALNAGVLKGLIVSELVNQGFVSTGGHARIEKMADAIATAVVAHITAAADVVVAGGSSAGTYKVS